MKDFRSALLSAASLACLLSLAACGGGSNPAANTNTASKAGRRVVARRMAMAFTAMACPATRQISALRWRCCSRPKP